MSVESISEPPAPVDQLSVTVSTHATPDAAKSEAAPRPCVQNSLPGMRPYEGRESRGVGDLRAALDLLGSADIPACVVGIRALRYYGAGRSTWEWDVCVPDEQLSQAVAVFQGNDSYEPATPPPVVRMSLRHKHHVFKLKDAGFFLILTPSSACFINPHSEFCELSNKGIPYPRMPQFASSLLVLQNGADIADFIDGMDLDEAWAEDNLDFAWLQEKGLEFTRKLNSELEELMQFNTDVDYRKMWNAEASTKERRIEPMKQGRYKTRWRRVKNDIDPRFKDRDM